MSRAGAHGLRSAARTLTIWVIGLGAGSIVPYVLYFVLVEFGWCLGMVCGASSILGLPDPLGLILWYLVLGAIGGIVPGGDWGLAYGLGLGISLLREARWFLVWPWAVLLVVSWIVVRLAVEWVRRGEPG